MPESAMIDTAAAIATVLAFVGGAFVAGYKLGLRQAARRLNNERESKRFTEVYAPLMGFFTTRHITTASGRGAPYLRQRIRNARYELSSGHLIQAALALFDKQDMGVSGEVEYGGSFPLSNITEHLRGREQFADQTLIRLVASADRARYEDPPQGNALTAADLALFDHVCRQHEALVRRFVGP